MAPADLQAAAKILQAQIFLVPLGHHLRPEMTEHSDLIINIFDLGFENPTRRTVLRPSK